MAKSLSTAQVLGIRSRTIVLSGEWGECVGEMARHGVVFVWGNSGNGKTTAVMQLCRELVTGCGMKGLYVSLEEGFSVSMQNTLRRLSMLECRSRFQILDSIDLDALVERLSKPRSAEFVVIDSIQYMQLTYKQYIALKERFRAKLFILVSHADGKQPEGRAARAIRYDAGLKIWVEGYKAFSKGRFIGPKAEAVVWRQGAEEYWGAKKKQEESPEAEESEDLEAPDNDTEEWEA